MIIIGYQGIGKTTLSYRDNNFVDLESSNFYNKGIRPENWYVYYCNIAASLSRQGFNVFVSSHEVVRNRLKKYFDTEKILCVYPSVELKNEWIPKLHRRFIESRMDKDFKAWMNALDRYEENIEELKNSGFECIELTSMDYDLEQEILNDII